MAQKKRKQKWAKNPRMEEFEDHRPLSQRFMRGLIPFAVLLLVLYAAVHLLSRTEGCRVLVSEKVEEHIGQPISIGRMWTDWSLNLHAVGMRTEGGYRNAVPGLEVEEVVVRWRWPSGRFGQALVRQIDVTGMKLSLVLDHDHQWQPEAFAPLATWLVRWGRLNLTQSAGEVTGGKVKPKRESGERATKEKSQTKPGEKTNGFWESVHIVLVNSEVRWWSVDGTEAASAIGIRLESIPLSVPRRSLHHYMVGIDRVRTSMGEEVEDLQFELLSTMGHHIVLGFQANWASAGSQAAEAGPPPESVSGRESRAPEETSSLLPTRSGSETRTEDRRSAEELADYFRDMLEGALMTD